MINSTQSPLHYAPTLAAARLGIRTFCEKPIAHNQVQADEMVRVCDEHKVKLAINHIKRASLYNNHVPDWIKEALSADLFVLEPV